MMVTAVGSAGIARAIELRGETVAKSEPAPPTAQAPADVSARIINPAAELVAQGVPVDSAKVEAIRSAIAQGTYQMDARVIAERMIATDLPKA